MEQCFTWSWQVDICTYAKIEFDFSWSKLLLVDKRYLYLNNQTKITGMARPVYQGSRNFIHYNKEREYKNQNISPRKAHTAWPQLFYILDIDRILSFMKADSSRNPKNAALPVSVPNTTFPTHILILLTLLKIFTVV